MNGPGTLEIYARAALAANSPPLGPALLLEGDWPPDQRAPNRWSLDSAIDARQAWIDVEAAQLAEQAARASVLADLLALKLRYYFVRLLRLIAWSELAPQPWSALRLHLETPRDDDYAELARALTGGRAEFRWSSSCEPPPARHDVEAWRRAAGWLASRLRPRRPSRGASPPRDVFLCGNPRNLEAVADAFRSAGYRPWWLYERFAAWAWLRRRPLGEGQLVCCARERRLAEPDAERVHVERLHVERLLSELPPLVSRGVDLRRTVAIGLAREAGRRVLWLAQTPAAVAHHFETLRPACVVLDQDATPLARAVVGEARRAGAPSLVVQHGAPCVRFGFAPLAADRFCAWGKPTRRTLIEWGIDPARIVVTGAPRLASKPHCTMRRRSAGRRPRILLLATVPPRDARPDAVEFHLTTETYAAMVAMVAEAAARLNADLTIRPHPRAADSTALEPLVRGGARIASHRRLESQVAQADCVISCASSAGLEAAWLGAAVIGLVPDGSAGVFSDPDWGLIGSARSADELCQFVEHALTNPARPSSRAFHVPANGAPAARVVAVAEEIMESRAAPPRSARRVGRESPQAQEAGR